MALVPFVDPAPGDTVLDGEFVAEPSAPTPEPVPADAPLSISFIASLAGVNTAAKPVSFDIDGAAKISLETDESQTPYVVALLALKRTRLLVTVTVDTSTLVSPATGRVKRSRKKKEPVVEQD